MAPVDFQRQQFLQALYVDHHGWLTSWLRNKLGCAVQAADLTQDAFVRVLRRQNDVAIREPRAYLTTIANGLVLDHWRRCDIERGWYEAIANEPAGAAPSPEQWLLVRDALYRIDRMLASLPCKLREAFLLSQVHGMTYMSIAQRLQV